MVLFFSTTAEIQLKNITKVLHWKLHYCFMLGDSWQGLQSSTGRGCLWESMETLLHLQELISPFSRSVRMDIICGLPLCFKGKPPAGVCLCLEVPRWKSSEKLFCLYLIKTIFFLGDTRHISKSFSLLLPFPPLRLWQAAVWSPRWNSESCAVTWSKAWRSVSDLH